MTRVVKTGGLGYLVVVLLLVAACSKSTSYNKAPIEAGAGAPNTGTDTGAVGSGGVASTTAAASSGGAANTAQSSASTGAGGGDGDCQPGTSRCSDTTPEICTPSEIWEPTRAPCATGCLGGACTDCLEGSTRCLDNAVETCREGQWAFDEQCSVACEKVDADASCVTACTEGNLQCNGDTFVQICEGGSYIDEQPCEFACEGGACSECPPNALDCVDNLPRVCSSLGSWEAQAACGGGEECQDGQCVAKVAVWDTGSWDDGSVFAP